MNVNFDWNEWFFIITTSVIFSLFLLVRDYFSAVIVIIIWANSNYQYIYFSPLFGIVNVLSKGRFVLKFGYARVSTQDQSLSFQLDALNHYEVDHI
jgi:hypothetical protein